MPIDLSRRTHIDASDRVARERWASHFGVSEERLRKVMRMVGSRLTTLAAHFGRPKP